MTASWMEKLNPAQSEAVTHGDGPLLVVAGAGTGKTLTLACRVAHLVQTGVAPERILLLTFTRRAAGEMVDRAGRLIGRSTDRVWGGTFHAVANRLLRLHGPPIGIRSDFTVMDQSDGADMMDLIRSELRLGSGKRRFPRKGTLAAIYSRTVNAGTRLTEVLDRAFPWCSGDVEGIREIFGRYVDRKRRQNVVDFDDLLLYWGALARGSRTARVVNDLFDHILVDEYQDTNALQAEILRHMRAGSANITVVGDDAQSIYSFRSATVQNILDFPDVFPGTRIVRLERNYRSTQHLLDASNAVIALSSRRHPKTLWTERRAGRLPALLTSRDEADQCDQVCRLLLEHREQGTPLKRQAVLFRTAHHSDQLEVELSRRNIPFVKYGGLRFLEASHVKDLLALLRLLENPYDEVSWFRALQLLDGVGPAAAERVMARLGVRRGGTDAEAGSPLRLLGERPPPVPRTAGEEYEQLRSALADCARADPPERTVKEADDPEATDLPPTAQIERLRRFLEPVFERRYGQPGPRLRDIDQLELLAARYTSRGRFIADLTLDPPNSTGDLAGPPLLDEDYAVLSTIHSAKGCEWDVVHVIHAADGMIPSDMATGSAEEIDEERRLLYVAMTRAKDALYVHFPLRYYRRPRGHGDAHAYAQLTRFIPEHVRPLFDVRSTVGVQGETDKVAAGVGDVREVAALIARLWE
jgi:DNA helicase-2/ATP-dependent DNA helicase PcrA